MTIEMDPATARQMAHAAVLHYEFLKRQEGKLPPTEAATLKAARLLEMQAEEFLRAEDAVRATLRNRG